jgi:hypothetical protein
MLFPEQRCRPPMMTNETLLCFHEDQDPIMR